MHLILYKSKCSCEGLLFTYPSNVNLLLLDLDYKIHIACAGMNPLGTEGNDILGKGVGCDVAHNGRVLLLETVEDVNDTKPLDFLVRFGKTETLPEHLDGRWDAIVALVVLLESLLL